MNPSTGSWTDLGTRIERLWANRWLRLAAICAGFAAVTVVTALIAKPRMFTIVMSYDDEGYMLTALKSFIHRGGLYNETFAQYGPFFFEFWGGLFSIFGIPVTHDAGRTITTIVWVTSCLGLGLVTMRLTRNLFLGLGTQILAFTVLTVLINEPMHPGGLITVLLVTILAISCFISDRRSMVAMYLLGIAVAALVLTKINIGGFAVISLALACAVTYPVLLRRRWVRPLIEAIFVATPILLMSSKFGEGWAVHYAFHVAIAALAVVIVLRARTNADRPWTDELSGLVFGFVAFVVLVLVVCVADGTTLSGLWEGLVTLPLNQSKAFTIPTELAKRVWVADAIALAGACGYWYLRRRRPGGELGRGWIAAISVLSIAVGVEMALSVIGKTFPSTQLTFPGAGFAALAFIWVALIPLGKEDPKVAFGRLFLPLLATLQSLHAFPVAGSQLGWSLFLLTTVAALCVGNGIRGLALATEGAWERWAAIALASLATLIAAQFLINTQLEEPYEFAHFLYTEAGRESVDLPGSGTIRIAPEELNTLRGVTDALEENCGAFLTEPGLGSFYLWTGREPPTGMFATAWTTLWDDKIQDRVIDETKDIKGLCLLRNFPLAEAWSYGPVPPGPLVEYLEEGFKPVTTVGSYEILRRPGYGSSH
jgi:hypothetical protein